jgi:hypothetical protein
MASTGANLEIQNARLFRGRAVLVVSAFGLLLVIPVLLSMLVVSSLRFGIWTVLVPLGVISVATLFLPFGFGNTYVRRLVRLLKPAHWKDAECFVVQITLIPRIHSGFRAVLEDADDIGCLNLSAAELVFQGDSVRFSIPYNQLRDLRLQTIGLRGLFVYPRLAISVTGLPRITQLRIAERAGWFLPTSRKRTRELHERLAARLQNGPGFASTSR